MKLVMAIIQDRDADAVLDRLNASRISVTKIATSGGFLREGNTTLLMGVEDSQIPAITEILRETCKRRKMFMPMAVGITDAAYGLHSQIEVEVGGATVFILNIVSFEQV